MFEIFNFQRVKLMKQVNDIFFDETLTHLFWSSVYSYFFIHFFTSVTFFIVLLHRHRKHFAVLFTNYFYDDVFTIPIINTYGILNTDSYNTHTHSVRCVHIFFQSRQKRVNMGGRSREKFLGKLHIFTIRTCTRHTTLTRSVLTIR